MEFVLKSHEVIWGCNFTKSFGLTIYFIDIWHLNLYKIMS